jgi:hypothetical protein
MCQYDQDYACRAGLRSILSKFSSEFVEFQKVRPELRLWTCEERLDIILQVEALVLQKEIPVKFLRSLKSA